MDLSIIIVSWNTRDLLANCLAAVFAYPPSGEYEVLVVDNASTDGSAAMVSARFPLVHLIQNSRNLGFARANNLALAQARGDFLLLLNSDTVVQPDALSRMLAFMQAHPSAGIVGAFVINPDGTPQRCFGRFPTLWSEAAFAWGLDTRRPFADRLLPPPHFSDDSLETDWVLGATMMIRRAALEQAGPLDEAYFMFSEEIDQSLRVRRRGWRNYALRDAVIVHLGQQSTRQVTAAMKAQLFKSKVLYFQKHEGRLPALVLQSVFAASILAKRLIYRLRGPTAQSRVWSQAWRYFTT